MVAGTADSSVAVFVQGMPEPVMITSRSTAATGSAAQSNAT